MKDYTKSNLNPHKQARIAMWLWSGDYAKSSLGSMEFYEIKLTDRQRRLCDDCLKSILQSRDKRSNEK